MPDDFRLPSPEDFIPADGYQANGVADVNLGKRTIPRDRETEGPSDRDSETTRGSKREEEPFSDSRSLSLSDSRTLGLSDTQSLGHSVTQTLGLSVSLSSYIVQTLPSRKEHIERRLLAFARLLRSDQEFADKGVDELMPELMEWHKQAQVSLGPKRPIDFHADVRGPFLAAWEKVKCLAGKGPMDTAWAESQKLPTPKEAMHYGASSRVASLARLCLVLARKEPDGVFRLDWRTAGRLLGVDYRIAGVYFRLLIADQVIKIVEEHDLLRATRYSYIGESL